VIPGAAVSTTAIVGATFPAKFAGLDNLHAHTGSGTKL